MVVVGEGFVGGVLIAFLHQEILRRSIPEEEDLPDFLRKLVPGCVFEEFFKCGRAGERAGGQGILVVLCVERERERERESTGFGKAVRERIFGGLLLIE